MHLIIVSALYMIIISVMPLTVCTFSSFQLYRCSHVSDPVAFQYEESRLTSQYDHMTCHSAIVHASLSLYPKAECRRPMPRARHQTPTAKHQTPTAKHHTSRAEHRGPNVKWHFLMKTLRDGGQTYFEGWNSPSANHQSPNSKGRIADAKGRAGSISGPSWFHVQADLRITHFPSLNFDSTRTVDLTDLVVVISVEVSLAWLLILERNPMPRFYGTCVRECMEVEFCSGFCGPYGFQSRIDLDCQSQL